MAEELNMWYSSSCYVVQTAVYNGVAYGRVVDKDGKVGPETPLESVGAMMPYTEFAKYVGDPTPILQALASAGVKMGDG